MIQFHDPRAATDITCLPYTLGIDLESQSEITVGFLANGFPDSDVFLVAVAEALAAHTGIKAKHWNKGNASVPASPAMLEEIRGSCQAVIAAYGH
ncbi:MAG TPA: hypothetical protein DCR65_12050 [Gammaproteobacteria bacterium]|jgi:hypothetical protein|nr:hypothetical protein [Gammaproteobacteria bacterium]